MVMNVKRRSICPSMFIFFGIMYMKDMSALNVAVVVQVLHSSCFCVKAMSKGDFSR